MLFLAFLPNQYPECGVRHNKIRLHLCALVEESQQYFDRRKTARHIDGNHLELQKQQRLHLPGFTVVPYS